MHEETLQEDQILRDAASVLQRRAGRCVNLADQLLALTTSPVVTTAAPAPNLQRMAAPPAARRRRTASPAPPAVPTPPAAPPPPTVTASPTAPAVKPPAFLTKADLEGSAPSVAPSAAPSPAPGAAVPPASGPSSNVVSKGASNKNLDRDQRILDIIAAHPGVHMSQIRIWLRDGKRGELLNPGTLHHVLNRLVSEKRILREAGGYHPATAADQD